MSKTDGPERLGQACDMFQMIRSPLTLKVFIDLSSSLSRCLGRGLNQGGILPMLSCCGCMC